MAIMSEGPEACELTAAARGRPGIWPACVLSAASEKAVVPIPRSLKKFRRLGLSIFSAPPCSVSAGCSARRLHWLRKLIWTCYVKLQYILGKGLVLCRAVVREDVPNVCRRLFDPHRQDYLDHRRNP